jgi:uncharacterized protein with HEPN domain
MLDRAREAVDLTRGKTKDELEHNRVLSLAVMHLVEIVGEAANRVPREEQTRYPDIKWKDIVGVRNRLIHGYDKVDPDVLWGIITIDLPPLIASLEAHLKKI